MSEEILTPTTEEEQPIETEVTGNSTTMDQPAQQETPQERQERLFSQADVDRIIQERIARERRKFEAEFKNNPHLSYLEQKAQRLGMTVEQLIENDKRYEEQERLNELIQKNIPKEYAEKLLKVDELEKWKHQTEQERQEEIKKREEEQRKQQMYQEFFQMYPDVKPEQIPAEVFQMVRDGHRLAAAYAIYENKLLKQQYQTQQANQKNAESSTGSAKSQGSTGGFISREQFEANKTNQKWVIANLDLIEKSRKQWK